MDTKDIYHYTFGLVLQGGGRSWRLDKRMYYGGYPADHLQMPPACTAKSGFIMAGLWNEAAQGIEGWPNRVATPREDGHADTPLARLLSITPDDGAALPPLAKLLRGTGPWEWGGAGKLYLFARGIAALEAPGTTSNKPPKIGSWRATAAHLVRLSLCGVEFELTFETPEAPWHFTAAADSDGWKGAVADGALVSRVQRSEHVLPQETALGAAPFGPAAEAEAERKLVEQLAASGPWAWAGNTPFGFMRGGELLTPWGLGKWGVRRASGDAAGIGAVYADFAGNEHEVGAADWACLKLRSRRKSDGEVVGLQFTGDDVADHTCRSTLQASLGRK